jgi:glycosyltransferase involved in cell wall biosynthesis
MDQPLNVVLRVRDAERTLAACIDRLLEVLPDLAERFAVLVVDQGSTDQTLEVAHELALVYPQLRVAPSATSVDTEPSGTQTGSQRHDFLVLDHQHRTPTHGDLQSLDKLRRIDPRDPTRFGDMFNWVTSPGRNVVNSG